jgi:hypothetical protein
VNSLTFDEVRHEYFLEGRRIPSVTQVLSDEGLADWTYCAEWARERGSLVHKAIHLALTTGLDWSTVHETFQPYVPAELQAIEDLGAEVVHSELRVASRISWYAGTLDRIVRLPRNSGTILALWDTKTGPVHPTYAAQTAAYAEAVHEMGILGSERIAERYALLLRPDGTYKLEPFDNRDDIHDFRAALRMVNFKRRNGLL